MSNATKEMMGWRFHDNNQRNMLIEKLFPYINMYNIDESNLGLQLMFVFIID